MNQKEKPCHNVTVIDRSSIASVKPKLPGGSAGAMSPLSPRHPPHPPSRPQRRRGSQSRSRRFGWFHKREISRRAVSRPLVEACPCRQTLTYDSSKRRLRGLELFIRYPRQQVAAGLFRSFSRLFQQYAPCLRYRGIPHPSVVRVWMS